MNDNSANKDRRSPKTARVPARRTCVVCATPRPQNDLLRLSVAESRVLFGATDPGRGAHVCVEQSCLAGLNARNLARAFRRPVPSPDTGRLRLELHSLAQRRVLEMVGLARRQGALRVGVERMASARTREDSKLGLALVSTDLSARSRRELGEQVSEFADSETLGRAAGMGPVGAMQITPGRLAKQAAYWLRVWYETREPGL